MKFLTANIALRFYVWDGSRKKTNFRVIVGRRSAALLVEESKSAQKKGEKNGNKAFSSAALAFSAYRLVFSFVECIG